MKICVLGLEGATPDIYFADERLTNLRRLMDLGTYGRLESEVPPARVPGWLCMATSQDPGTIGVYGARNRRDYSYNVAESVASASIGASAIWELLSAQGRKSVIGGLPALPPQTNAVRIGCSPVPDSETDKCADSANVNETPTELAGRYPVDVTNSRNGDRDRLRDEIFEMSRQQWKVVHRLLKEYEWDYFHFVDLGLDRVQHGFWQYFDPQHQDPNNSYQHVVPDYYAWLDEQIGLVMAALDSETTLLVMSAFGAKSVTGELAINQWLMEQGLLVLDEPVEGVTSFENLRVNWPKTRAWSEGGVCASVFLNVQGREPQGLIVPSEYELFRDELKIRLESLVDDTGVALNALVYKPDQLYRQTSGVPPDLIVRFSDFSWRTAGGVGYRSVYLRQGALLDHCNNSQNGVFTLVAPNNPLTGEYEGARVLDMVPTLLDLAGFAFPNSMQGRSLVGGMEKQQKGDGTDEERLILDRLAGLGYV